MKPSDIIKKALTVFGAPAQMAMFREECTEALLAMSHYERGRVRIDAVIEEVADVLITAESARLILGPELVDAAKQRKLDRLVETMADAELRRGAANAPPR